MSYNSKYTGKQVEEILDKANSSTNITESTVANWGFTKNTGTYSKPSGGIPKTDLASAVQTSLGKADTALQSVPSEYVTETELNNKGYATSSQLNTGFADAERKFAALNEEMDNKQPKLVSGTNIKTINGTSILGSGDIVIEGGSGDSSEEVYVWYLDNVSEGTISLQVYEKLKTVKTIIGVNNSKFYHASSRLVFRGNITSLTLTAVYTNVVINYNFSFHKIEDGYDYISELYLYEITENYIRVEHGTSDTTFTLTPNTFHVWDEVASLDLSFVEETTGVTNEYTFQFTSGATPTSLTLPDTIQWVNGAPNIEANKTYQVSIVNNIGLIVRT